MKLKYIHPNGEIVLEKKPNHALKKFENFEKLHSEMHPTSYFFQEDALTARNTRMSITFSQQIQMK